MHYRPTTQIRFGPPITPVVKMLVIANVAIFVFSLLVPRFGLNLNHALGLIPYRVTHSFYIWELVTYMFLHGGFYHILFNMLGLWMFGSDLEKTWGSEKFLFYYFLTGIGGGICYILIGPSVRIPTVGASAAVYGILLAFGMLFPNRIILVPILFFFFIPLRAKYLVMIVGGIALLNSLSVAATGINDVAHLGGMIFGYLYLRRGGGEFFGARSRYESWKREQLRKKFKVYMDKHDRDDKDRWIN